LIIIDQTSSDFVRNLKFPYLTDFNQKDDFLFYLRAL